MSHQEFENYLNLLARLLRLNPQQLESVSDEFRAHMEDRLDDLLGRGIPRDQAVQMALAEFGDAAGLAANITSLSWNRQRRWIMRISAATVAASVALAVGIVALWPEAKHLTAPTVAVAQGPGGAGPGAGPVLPGAGAMPGKPRTDSGVMPAMPGAGIMPGMGGPPPGHRFPGVAKPEQDEESRAASAELAEKLRAKIDADFSETTLKDVLEHISDQTKIQFYPDTAKIAETGIQLDASPVTARIKGIRVKSLLSLILKPLGLTTFEREGLLVITSLEDADSQVEIRVYNCRDLLSGGHSATPSIPGMLEGMMGGSSSGSGAMMGMGSSMVRPVQFGGMGGGMGGMGGGMGGMGSGGVPGMSSGGVLGADNGGGGGHVAAGMSPAERRAQRFMSLITTAVQSSTWSDNGGSGTISEFNGLIVISHNVGVHAEVESVLRMMREASAMNPVGPGHGAGGPAVMGMPGGTVPGELLLPAPGEGFPAGSGGGFF